MWLLRNINDALIVFFRGQVLVAVCDGILYGIGFLSIGLPYALLLGLVAMVLTIVPFLGAIVTCCSALAIAVIQFGDWQHPLLVLMVFLVVQTIEGWVIQPKIIGDRVGAAPGDHHHRLVGRDHPDGRASRGIAGDSGDGGAPGPDVSLHLAGGQDR